MTEVARQRSLTLLLALLTKRLRNPPLPPLLKAKVEINKYLKLYIIIKQHQNFKYPRQRDFFVIFSSNLPPRTPLISRVSPKTIDLCEVMQNYVITSEHVKYFKIMTVLMVCQNIKKRIIQTHIFVGNNLPFFFQNMHSFSSKKSDVMSFTLKMIFVFLLPYFRRINEVFLMLCQNLKL